MKQIQRQMLKGCMNMCLLLSNSMKNVDIYTINGYFLIPRRELSSLLLALRHGSFSGYSVGFDPINITTSAMGLSEDIPKVAYEYSVADSWEKMELTYKEQKYSLIQ